MKSMIFVVVLIFGIISYVQTRSLKDRDRDSESSKEYFIESPNYSDLFASLNRKTNRYEYDDDTNQPIDSVMSPRKGQGSFIDRRILRLDNIPSRHSARPSSSFGRKSHWDTFFG